MFIAMLYSIGPEVVLDCDFLDMGVVESGKFAAKSFKIINNAEVPAAFQVRIRVNISQRHTSSGVAGLLCFTRRVANVQNEVYSQKSNNTC